LAQVALLVVQALRVPTAQTACFQQLLQQVAAVVAVALADQEQEMTAVQAVAVALMTELVEMELQIKA
jgi:hypothetical protein